jgi:hypothetical protein
MLWVLEEEATPQFGGGWKFTLQEFIVQAQKIVQSFEGGSIIDESHRGVSYFNTIDNNSFDNYVYPQFSPDLSNSYLFFIWENWRKNFYFFFLKKIFIVKKLIKLGKITISEKLFDVRLFHHYLWPEHWKMLVMFFRSWFETLNLFSWIRQFKMIIFWRASSFITFKQVSKCITALFSSFIMVPEIDFWQFLSSLYLTAKMLLQMHLTPKLNSELNSVPLSIRLYKSLLPYCASATIIFNLTLLIILLILALN